jgi:glycosyltransferase involved in cell wall biosynthesis
LNQQKQTLISHPTGNTFVRALLEECEKEGNLQNFFTTIGRGKDHSFFNKLLNRRSYSIPNKRIICQWFPETLRLLFGKYVSQNQRRVWVDKSYEQLDKFVSNSLHKLKPNSIHAYEDGAAFTFKQAKKLGIYCSYELPIAYWATSRRLLAEEAERHPEWIPTLDSIHEGEEKLERKEQELRLADTVSCPSNFVLQSIPTNIRNSKQCQVANFGSPIKSDFEIKNCEDIQNKKLKILFVGSMSQRKGLADLFKALKILNTASVSLTVIGQPAMPLNFYKSKCAHFKHIPTCSNEKVKSTMRTHDILVLPSIVEGCALVQQEALSCGLPILITRNTGGEDLVDEGKTGFIIPIRDPISIAEKIEWFLMNHMLIADMRIECQKKADTYTWQNYAKKIIKSINLFPR